MSDRIKRFLAIAMAGMNGFLAAIILMTGFYYHDEDFMAFMGIGGAFLLNTVLMVMYSKTLKQDIEMKELLKEENKYMHELRRQEYDETGETLSDAYEEDLRDVLTRDTQPGTERKTQ